MDDPAKPALEDIFGKRIQLDDEGGHVDTLIDKKKDDGKKTTPETEKKSIKE